MTDHQAAAEHPGEDSLEEIQEKMKTKLYCEIEEQNNLINRICLNLACTPHISASEYLDLANDIIRSQKVIVDELQDSSYLYPTPHLYD